MRTKDRTYEAEGIRNKLPITQHIMTVDKLIKELTRIKELMKKGDYPVVLGIEATDAEPPHSMHYLHTDAHIDIIEVTDPHDHPVIMLRGEIYEELII